MFGAGKDGSMSPKTPKSSFCSPEQKNGGSGFNLKLLSIASNYGGPRKIRSHTDDDKALDRSS
jgi:hypothetical protein